MDFSKFLQFPGVLVLVGVLLLIVAVVISISSGLKKKKGNNINQPAIYNDPGFAQPDMASPMGQPNMNGNPMMNEPNNMVNNNPMGIPTVDNNVNQSSNLGGPSVSPMMDSNPMGMPTPDDTVSSQHNFGGPSVPPMMDNNLMGMTTPNDTVSSQPNFGEPSVPPVQPVVEEKKEPLTNPWANATTAYGGANPMDGVNININQGPQEPYGEKNFVASETPSINAMPKEEAVVMPTINEATKTNDDLETL